MYKIYLDDNVINFPFDKDMVVAEPKLTLEMGKAGSLEFCVAATNPLLKDISILKTKARVEIDGKELFRGRVLTIEKDFYNTKKIYCEGDLAYLVDSVQKPEKYKGKTHDFFKKMVENHNAMVDADKQFLVGAITIEDRDIFVSGTSDTDKTESGEFDFKQIVINGTTNNWSTTYDYMESTLIDYCGGYLRTRHTDEGTYLDLITDFGTNESQLIEFGYNLLDLAVENEINDLFTVLIPLGDNNLDISSVNNGSNELVDEERAAQYGRIVKTKTFSNVSSASTLLENAKRFMENQDFTPDTYSVNAVDLHFLDESKELIGLGDQVQVNSTPHGVSEKMTCTKIEYDLENPENTEYTFGKPHQTLTQRYREDQTSSGGGGGSGETSEEESEEATETAGALQKFYDAYINVDAESASAELGATYKEVLNQAITVLSKQVGIQFNAVSGNVNINNLDSRVDEQGQMLSDASASISTTTDDVNALIQLTTGYTKDALAEGSTTGSWATVELLSNDLQSQITANANKIALKADTVTVNAKLTEIESEMVKIKGSLTVSAGTGGTVATFLVPIVATQRVYINDGNLCVGGNPYKSTSITSTSGKVMVLGTS